MTKFHFHLLLAAIGCLMLTSCEGMSTFLSSPDGLTAVAGDVAALSEQVAEQRAAGWSTTEILGTGGALSAAAVVASRLMSFFKHNVKTSSTA